MQSAAAGRPAYAGQPGPDTGAGSDIMGTTSAVLLHTLQPPAGGHLPAGRGGSRELLSLCTLRMTAAFVSEDACCAAALYA